MLPPPLSSQGEVGETVSPQEDQTCGYDHPLTTGGWSSGIKKHTQKNTHKETHTKKHNQTNTHTNKHTNTQTNKPTSQLCDSDKPETDKQSATRQSSGKSIYSAQLSDIGSSSNLSRGGTCFFSCSSFYFYFSPRSDPTHFTPPAASPILVWAVAEVSLNLFPEVTESSSGRRSRNQSGEEVPTLHFLLLSPFSDPLWI